MDARSFELKLARPFGPVCEALARPTATALFVMPERIASVPAHRHHRSHRFGAVHLPRR